MSFVAGNKKSSAIVWRFFAFANLRATEFDASVNSCHILLLVLASGIKSAFLEVISFVLKLDILAKSGCLVSKWHFSLLGFDSTDRMPLQITHCGFSIPAATMEVNYRSTLNIRYIFFS